LLNNDQQLDNGLAGDTNEENEDIINNGVFSSENDDLYTITGDLSGSGIFTTDVKLLGADVNPGNSPGLLTFAADLFIDGTDADLTNLLIEITGTETRGVDYDAIDVYGNLQFLTELNISTSIFPSITRENLLGVEFDILHVDGDILDASNNIVEFDNLSNLTINIEDSWGFRWFERVSGWGLAIFTSQDSQDNSSNEVSEPKTIFIASFCLLLFGFRKYRSLNLLKE
jgi:hypothetical protein